MSDFEVTFERISGILNPCLPIAPDGTVRKHDGIRYLSCEQYIQEAKVTEAAAHEAYGAFLQDVGTGSRGGQSSQVADDVLRQRFAHLSDQHFGEYKSICAMRNFNPLGQHVWHEIRAGKSRRPELHVGLTAAGFYATALRTGELRKLGKEEWCGRDRQYTDLWVDKDQPFAARVLVERRGVDEPFEGVAKWENYAPYQLIRGERVYDDFWLRMPDHMLAKCAACLAIRKAFAEQLDGIYSPEEMAQSKNPSPSGSAPSGGEPAPDWTPVSLKDLPKSSQAFHLRLMDYGLGNIKKRNAVIEQLRSELAMLYGSNIASFYEKAIERVRENPSLYGACPAEEDSRVVVSV